MIFSDDVNSEFWAANLEDDVIMPAQDPYLFLRKCIKTIHTEDVGIAFFASGYAGLLLFLRAVGLIGNRNFGGETPFFVRKILPTAAMHGNGNRRATHLLGPYTASFFSRLNLAAAPGHEIRNPADVNVRCDADVTFFSCNVYIQCNIMSM